MAKTPEANSKIPELVNTAKQLTIEQQDELIKLGKSILFIDKVLKNG